MPVLNTHSKTIATFTHDLINNDICPAILREWPHWFSYLRVWYNIISIYLWLMGNILWRRTFEGLNIQAILFFLCLNETNRSWSLFIRHLGVKFCATVWDTKGKCLCISRKYKKGPSRVMKGWLHTMEMRQGVHDHMSVRDKLGWEFVLHIQTSHPFSLI